MDRVGKVEDSKGKRLGRKVGVMGVEVEGYVDPGAQVWVEQPRDGGEIFGV